MGKLTFIIGGARSGKSGFALREASSRGGRRAFVATLEPLDEEMVRRVARHREERGPGWDAFEEPLELAGLLKKLPGDYDVAIVDCLTLWLSNVMHAGRGVEEEAAALAASLAEAKESMRLFVVSNEVGMGIVPENALSRAFRDHAGSLNQLMAGLADEVFLVAAGMPIKIK